MDMKIGPLKNLEAVFNENLPHILSGTAVVGVVTTSVAAAKAWEKIKEVYASEKSAEEKTKEAIKTIAPAVTSGLITIGCIVSSDIVHTKRYSTLLAAYVAAKTELPKAKEILAIEDKSSGIKAIDDKTGKTEESERRDNVYVKDVKIYRVVDLETGYEFESSIALLKGAEKTVEKLVCDSGSCSLDTFYDEADYGGRRDRWSPNIAEDIRWEVDKWNSQHMELDIGAEVDDTGEVYLTISYNH